MLNVATPMNGLFSYCMDFHPAGLVGIIKYLHWQNIFGNMFEITIPIKLKYRFAYIILYCNITKLTFWLFSYNNNILHTLFYKSILMNVHCFVYIEKYQYIYILIQ